MNSQEHMQAVLLLTSRFSKQGSDAYKPLTPGEWGRFASWLNENSISPEDLLGRHPGPAEILTQWSDRDITIERIKWLLERSSAMALSLEKWQRAGLWVLTRSDPEYPARLKKHLGSLAPPFFYGCGNRSLLDKGGIAVVGSRNVSKAESQLAKRLGSEAALQSLSIVSGGARGIDEDAMQGALEREGTVIGVLACDLLRAATSARYRSALTGNDLVLVSPFYPEAGFDVGNAMARNRYIYCLGDAAVVVCSTKDKGGTWAGAVENLKKNWVPLWVGPVTGKAPSGNEALVQQGAHWLPSVESLDLQGLTQAESVAQLPAEQMETLFDIPLSGEGAVLYSKNEPQSPGEVTDKQTESAASASAQQLPDITLYEHFLLRLQAMGKNGPVTVDQLVLELELTRSQANEWLMRAVGEGRVGKHIRPTRYQWLG